MLSWLETPLAHKILGVVILIECLGFAFSYVYGLDKDASQTLAYWVQALGSMGTIAGAFWLSRRQQLHQLAQENAARVRLEEAAVRAKDAERKAFLDGFCHVLTHAVRQAGRCPDAVSQFYEGDKAAIRLVNQSIEVTVEDFKQIRLTNIAVPEALQFVIATRGILMEVIAITAAFSQWRGTDGATVAACQRQLQLPIAALQEILAEVNALANANPSRARVAAAGMTDQQVSEMA